MAEEEIISKVDTIKHRIGDTALTMLRARATQNGLDGPQSAVDTAITHVATYDDLSQSPQRLIQAIGAAIDNQAKQVNTPEGNCR